LEDEARRLGYQELYLKTEYSRNFYEQLGWKVFEVIPGMTSASFLMNKTLARSNSS
jgi:N-acetylglutamate synthase-like GNAT family acetyltransferase